MSEQEHAATDSKPVLEQGSHTSGYYSACDSLYVLKMMQLSPGHLRHLRPQMREDLKRPRPRRGGDARRRGDSEEPVSRNLKLWSGIGHYNAIALAEAQDIELTSRVLVHDYPGRTYDNRGVRCFAYSSPATVAPSVWSSPLVVVSFLKFNPALVLSCGMPMALQMACIEDLYALRERAVPPGEATPLGIGLSILIPFNFYEIVVLIDGNDCRSITDLFTQVVGLHYDQDGALLPVFCDCYCAAGFDETTGHARCTRPPPEQEPLCIELAFAAPWLPHTYVEEELRDHDDHLTLCPRKGKRGRAYARNACFLDAWTRLEALSATTSGDLRSELLYHVPEAAQSKGVAISGLTRVEADEQAPIEVDTDTMWHTEGAHLQAVDISCITSFANSLSSQPHEVLKLLDLRPSLRSLGCLVEAWRHVRLRTKIGRQAIERHLGPLGCSEEQLNRIAFPVYQRFLDGVVQRTCEVLERSLYERFSVLDYVARRRTTFIRPGGSQDLARKASSFIIASVAASVRLQWQGHCVVGAAPGFLYYQPSIVNVPAIAAFSPERLVSLLHESGHLLWHDMDLWKPVARKLHRAALEYQDRHASEREGEELFATLFSWFFFPEPLGYLRSFVESMADHFLTVWRMVPHWPDNSPAPYFYSLGIEQPAMPLVTRHLVRLVGARMLVALIEEEGAARIDLPLLHHRAVSALIDELAQLETIPQRMSGQEQREAASALRRLWSYMLKTGDWKCYDGDTAERAQDTGGSLMPFLIFECVLEGPVLRQLNDIRSQLIARQSTPQHTLWLEQIADGYFPEPNKELWLDAVLWLTTQQWTGTPKQTVAFLGTLARAFETSLLSGDMA